MQIKNFFYASIIVSLSTGCNTNNEPQKLHYYNDIDNQVSWNQNKSSNIIKVKNAASGMYVCEVKELDPYSVTFHMPIEQISDVVLKKIHVKAKVFIESPESDPLLVIDVIDKDGRSLEWLPKGITDKAKSLNTWVELKNELDLTVSNRNFSGNSFKVYVSNGKSERALVDDIEVTFEN